MRKSWSDDRIDHLSYRVDEGSRLVDERFKLVDRRFELDRMQQGIMVVGASLFGTTILAFSGLIATQL